MNMKKFQIDLSAAKDKKERTITIEDYIYLYMKSFVEKEFVVLSKKYKNLDKRNIKAKYELYGEMEMLLKVGQNIGLFNNFSSYKDLQDQFDELIKIMVIKE